MQFPPTVALSTLSASPGVFGVFFILLTRFGTIFKTINEGYALLSSQAVTIVIHDKAIGTKPLAHGIPRRSTGWARSRQRQLMALSTIEPSLALPWERSGSMPGSSPCFPTKFRPNVMDLEHSPR